MEIINNILPKILLFLTAINTICGENYNVTTEKTYPLNSLFKEIDRHFTDYPEALKNECFRDIQYVINHTTEEWALNMIESTGKFPIGLYSGNLNSLGHYDQCLRVDYKGSGSDSERHIVGKYCLAQVPVGEYKYLITNRTDLLTAYSFNSRFTNMLNQQTLIYNSGICIPNSCKSEDVLEIIQNFTWINMTSVLLPEAGCSTAKKISYTAGDIWTIFIIICLILIVLSSTAYELYSEIDSNAAEYQYCNLLITFSIKKNTLRLLSSNDNADNIKCLNGIRSLSMLWIIFCHRYLVTYGFPSMNFIDIIHWISSSNLSMLVTAGPIAVDTFLFMSGFLVAYLIFKRIENNVPFSYFKFMVHRSLRLTPVLMLLVLIQGTIYKHFGSGPLWNGWTNSIVGACQTHWWSTLLYLQNLINPNEMCLGHSWYLAVDMQLFSMAVVLIIPLIQCQKIGRILLVLTTFASYVYITISVILNKWPGATVSLRPEGLHKELSYYILTEMRASVWLFGFGFGYWLVKIANLTKPHSKIVNTIGWIYSVFASSMIILAMKYLQKPDHEFSYITDSTYNCLSKVIWSSAIGWIIYSCMRGYGGIANWFLSLRIWEVVSRLSYLMYLVHIPLQFYYVSLMRFPAQFSHYSVFYNFCGDIVITMTLSYLLAITVEFPITNLEKYFSQTSCKKPVTHSTTSSMPEIIPLHEINLGSSDRFLFVETAEVHAENSNAYGDDNAIICIENEDKNSNK